MGAESTVECLMRRGDRAQGAGAWLVAGLLCLALAACADDNPGPTTDGPVIADSAVDFGVAPDLLLTLPCEKTCTSSAPYLCVTAANTGTCVECEADGHCLGNKGALGTLCVNRLCTCKDSADCAHKLFGKVCQGAAPTSCGCEKDTDCPSPRLCMGDLYGTAICVPPCKKDGDCAVKTRPYCNTTTGRCGACLVDSHCAKSSSGKYCHPTLNRCVRCKRNAHCTSSTAPLCDLKKGSCVACLTSNHCAAHQNGSTCSEGACTCKDNKACAGPNPFGDACSTSSKRCACTANSQCAKNANGPTCNTKVKKCTCQKDSECKTAPYTRCLAPYKGASYKMCALRCQKNTDCVSVFAPVCNTKTGGCFPCQKSADCSSETFATRCSSSGRCVECTKDAECTATTLGKTCSSGTCLCQKDADCADRASGKLCLPNHRVCGCVKLGLGPCKLKGLVANCTDPNAKPGT